MAKQPPAPPPASNRPAATFRIGYVKATVWQNGTHFNTVFTRSFKNGDNWEDGDSFGHADLPVLSRLAERVESYIHTQAHIA